MSYEPFFWICLLLVLKSITVGSDFNFLLWARYSKKYTNWYFKQDSFKQWLDKNKD